MIDRDREKIEFGARLAQMQERLASRGVLVEKKRYAAEAFGSWQVVAGTEEKKLEFIYDGKDSYLTYHDAAIVPKDFRDCQQKRFRTWGMDQFGICWRVGFG